MGRRSKKVDDILANAEASGLDDRALACALRRGKETAGTLDEVRGRFGDFDVGLIDVRSADANGCVLQRIPVVFRPPGHTYVRPPTVRGGAGPFREGLTK